MIYIIVYEGQLFLIKGSEALLDPFVRMVDVEGEKGEVRETVIGLSIAWQLLYVVYTLREGDIFRIISARPVTKTERRYYEEW